MSDRTFDDDELSLLLIFGFIGLVIAGGGAAAKWDQLTAWLVSHGWLVPPVDGPLIRVPGASGAGLDWARTLVIVGVVLGLVACSIAGARARRARREER